MRLAPLALACLTLGAQDAPTRQLPAVSDGSILQVTALEIRSGPSLSRQQLGRAVNTVSLRAAIVNTSSTEVRLSRFLLDAAFCLYGRFEDSTGLQWEIPRSTDSSHVTPSATYLDAVVVLKPNAVEWLAVSLPVSSVPLAPVNQRALRHDVGASIPREFSYSVFAPVYVLDPDKPGKRTAVVLSGSCNVSVVLRANPAPATEPVR